MTRYLAFLLRQLMRRFRASEDTLRTDKGRPFPDPAIEAHAAQFAMTLAGGALQVKGLLAHPLLRSTRPEPLEGSALQSLADQPVFGALHRAGRRLLDPGLAYGPNGGIASALKHTYDLFEIFVLFRLVTALTEALGPGWKARDAKPLHAARREERPANRAAWWFDGPDKTSVELRYQQWFSRARPAPDGRLFSSLSGVGIPDYILIVRRDGKPVGWLILDAKYRSSRQAVDDGLAEVHRYRDALRVRGRGASGAFVVVPQLRDVDPPYGSPAFLRHHAFGALKLSDGKWLDPVASILAAECRRPPILEL